MSGKKNNVVARLTITRANDQKLIIEVHSDATFSSFYQYFRQTGNRRSTKEFIRTGNRNDGLSAMESYRKAPGLDVLATGFAAKQTVFYDRDGQMKERNPITSMKLRIIRKREYKRLLHAAPVGMPVVKPIFPVRNPKAGILLLLPTRRANVQVGE